MRKKESRPEIFSSGLTRVFDIHPKLNGTSLLVASVAIVP